MTKLTQLLREPLLHFLLIGAALFGAYAWLNRGAENAAAPQVRLAESDVRWLKETFALEHQREPSGLELQGLVHGFLKEEMLARQAQELGLHTDDIVVRRRLAQKMTFLLQDESARAVPSEDDLRHLYETQRDHPPSEEGQARALFTRPRISFGAGCGRWWRMAANECFAGGKGASGRGMAFQGSETAARRGRRAEYAMCGFSAWTNSPGFA